MINVFTPVLSITIAMIRYDRKIVTHLIEACPNFFGSERRASITVGGSLIP